MCNHKQNKQDQKSLSCSGHCKLGCMKKSIQPSESRKLHVGGYHNNFTKIIFGADAMHATRHLAMHYKVRPCLWLAARNSLGQTLNATSPQWLC